MRTTLTIPLFLLSFTALMGQWGASLTRPHPHTEMKAVYGGNKVIITGGNAVTGAKHALKITTNIASELGEKTLHSISIFNKCAQKNASVNTGICFIAAHLYPDGLLAKAKSIGGNVDITQFSNFIAEVIDQTQNHANYALAEAVEKTLKAGSEAGPSLFHAWDIMKRGGVDDAIRTGVTPS